MVAWTWRIDVSVSFKPSSPSSCHYMWFAKEVCILTGGNKLKVDSEQAGTERAFNTCLRAKILELQHWTLVIHCWQAFRVGAALTLPLCLRRSVGIPAQLASLRLAVGGACSFVFFACWLSWTCNPSPWPFKGFTWHEDSFSHFIPHCSRDYCFSYHEYGLGRWILKYFLCSTGPVCWSDVYWDISLSSSCPSPHSSSSVATLVLFWLSIMSKRHFLQQVRHATVCVSNVQLAAGGGVGCFSFLNPLASSFFFRCRPNDQKTHFSVRQRA